MGHVDPNNLLAEQMLEAIGAYGAVVAAANLDDIRDVRELPYPKETMVGILLAALATIDDPDIRESLRQGFFLLAQFQPGVGDEFPTLERGQELTRQVRADRQRLTDLYERTFGHAA